MIVNLPINGSTTSTLIIELTVLSASREGPAYYRAFPIEAPVLLSITRSSHFHGKGLRMYSASSVLDSLGIARIRIDAFALRRRLTGMRESTDAACPRSPWRKRSYGVTVRTAGSFTPPELAVIFARVLAVTVCVVTVKFADVAPAGTVALEGTAATAGLLLERVTSVFPDGAGPLRVTWLAVTRTPL
jgi:hypothetical protein